MQNLLEKIDTLAAIETENRNIRWLERGAFVFLILMFVFAPHSIAATQTAWLTGMFLWVIRMLLKSRPPLVRTPLDIPLWAFFLWSSISSIFSYDPLVSLDKLRLNVALFLIFYFVINVVKTKRSAVFLALLMIASTMVSVAWTPIERIFGRGVQIIGVSANSPLAKALLMEGDTLLKANGKKINVPEDLVAEAQTNETTKIDFYRPDFYFTVEIKRADLLAGASALEQLGIADWKRSRNWRSTGFYSHYATFAEVLQLIASLAFGLFIVSLSGKFFSPNRVNAENAGSNSRMATASTRSTLILAVCLAGMSFALLLTVTRASQLAFLISAFAIVVATGNRKMFLMLAAIALPVAVLGLVFLQQSRQVSFFDANDDSIKDRQTFYRRGFDLWTKDARNFMLGVGMDANKRFIKEWNLYDNDGKPMGHFHSTPLQLLVERGLPALLLWLWILWVYGRTLWRGFKVQDSGLKTDNLISASSTLNSKSGRMNQKNSDWHEKGIILGGFGGMIGFFAGGVVHYNLGDAEVEMVFFMLMGLSVYLAVRNSSRANSISNSES